MSHFLISNVELDIKVEYEYSKAFAGNMNEPPYDEEFELLSVQIMPQGVEIKQYLPEELLDFIMEDVKETHDEQGDIPDREDFDDEENF